MKDDYIAALNRALMFYQIENKDEILKKYEKRYDFGIESELTEDEIEKMLGNPTEIAKKLSETKPIAKEEFSDSVEFKPNYNLIIKTVNDNIVIRRSNDDKIHTYLDNTDMNAYTLKNNDIDGVMMAYKTGSWFSLNRRHNGALEIDIPEKTVFDKIEITSQVGQIVIEIPLEGNDITIEATSSNGDIADIMANNIYIHSVSGDMNFNKLSARTVKLSTVSGDLNVNQVDATDIIADSISGDIKVLASNARAKTSAITGDIIIGSSNTKNFKTKAKEFFKR
ncbi:MAG: DUF4097 family beta strand repeat-containing protein [Acholeplasmatales bacterium]|nr:DUF4097 family beta strand repeat-containing protein [Acholeplasmatales bacterium]